MASSKIRFQRYQKLPALPGVSIYLVTPVTQYTDRATWWRPSVAVTICGMAGNILRFAPAGAEMRNVREANGISIATVASELGVTKPTIVRWEKGDRTPSDSSLRRYLEAVEATSFQIENILRFAREAQTSPWASGRVPAHYKQLSALLEVERNASTITIVSPWLVPGLLQTGDYVRGMMQQADVPADEIDTRVIVRLGRKDAITKKNPADLVAIVGETALHTNIGGPEVMADQLRSLLESMEMPNVELRVIPFEAGWTPAIDGMFVLIGFAEGASMVQTDHRGSSLFFHEPADVVPFQQIAERVLEVAMSPASSRALIAERIKQLESLE